MKRKIKQNNQNVRKNPMRTVKGQPRKDSESKRVNFDNTRESKFRRDVEKEFDRNDGNDPAWYTKNAGLTTGSTMIPFNTVLGSRPPYAPSTQVDGVPGVMAISFVPNFVPDDGYVINQCAQSYYSEVVHANSRNQSYDPADLMIVTMAASQIFAAIGNMIRVYGIMNQYSAENRYLPEALVQACGFSASDLRQNYSHMLFDINQLIAQTRQLWVPNSFPIINRWFWMNSTIYTDSDTIKPQMYLYRQNRFYKYSGFTDKKGGKLVACDENFASVVIAWSSYVSMVQKMLEALITDQDRGIMFGDILKCYGAEKIFVLNEIGWDYRTQIVYSKEVLWQFENTITGIPSTFWIKELTQDAYGRINQTWTTTATSTPTSSTEMYKPDIAVLNFHQKETPTSEQILVATRMMCLGNYEASTDKENVKINLPAVSGTEIAQTFTIFRYNYTAPFNSTGGVGPMSLSGKIGDSGLTTEYLFLYNSFDWCPALYAIKVGTTHDSVMVTYFNSTTTSVVAEYDNYTYIEKDLLKRIHLTAIYSLFNVPLL